MVDHLSDKLETFRRVWKAKAAEINMGELISERLGMTKHKDDPRPDYDYEAPVAAGDENVGTLEGQPSPGPLEEEAPPPKEYMLIAFDMSVWQRHDVEGKLQAFGGHGIKEVDAALLPPEEPPVEPPPEEIEEEAMTG